jgi:hypothetical protein
VCKQDGMLSPTRCVLTQWCHPHCAVFDCVTPLTQSDSSLVQHAVNAGALALGFTPPGF